MRDGQQPELRPSVLRSPRSPNKPRECTGKCRQFNGFGLVQAGSGPGGRWFKSTRPDQLFHQSLTRPRFPPDWVHLGPTSASRVQLPLQFAHEIQDASVYSATLFANWNDQDERHGDLLFSNQVCPVLTPIFAERCPFDVQPEHLATPETRTRHRCK
jgi:hypothetical protein